MSAFDPMDEFGKYAQGIPLSAENAAVLEGAGPAKPEIPAAPSIVPLAARAVIQSDRRDLQEMMSLPGWQVYLRVQQKALADHHAHAISVSESPNALGRAAEIAERWAYWGLYKAAHAEMLARVNEELRKLREEK